MKKGGKFRIGARSVTGPILWGRIAKFFTVDDRTQCWIWTGQRWKSGYPKLWVHYKALKVTRLVAWMRGILTDLSLEVCHRCNNKACINPDHLYAGTHKQNIQDAERDGLVRHLYGENHPRAKLSHDEVLDILSALDQGISNASLARLYKVDRSCISLIKRGINWKYLRDGGSQPVEEGVNR